MGSIIGFIIRGQIRNEGIDISIREDLAITNKNIMLTGFMGSGKTTVGCLLAELTGQVFLDADREIEHKYGMPITEIFQKAGEAAFRQMEREYMLGLCRNERQTIVSLGGGAFMQEEIRDACLSSSLVVFLDIGWDAWQERHQLLMETRPLLQSKSLEEIRKLFEARREIYALSHLTVLTDDLTPEEIAERILRACSLIEGGE